MISGGQGAHDGVADGVQQDVGVGVAEQAEAIGDLHAAENQLPFLHQAVDVIPVTDADHVNVSPDELRQKARATSRSSGRGDFDIAVTSLDHGHGMAQPLDQRGVVGTPETLLQSLLMGAADDGERKACGVCASHKERRSGVCRIIPPSTCLIVSLTGTPTTHPPTRRAPAITPSMRSAAKRGRTPSWIRMMSSGAAPQAARPLRTESWRSAPPSTSSRTFSKR